MNSNTNSIVRLSIGCAAVSIHLSSFANPCLTWTEEFRNEPGLVIGTVEVNTADIFDLSKPKESRIVHQLSNRIHSKTKPWVIKRQLLFKEGDTFKQRTLEESTRLIRANSYIKDVDIIPYEVCGRKVNIKVNTSDKWTLSPGVSFGRSGGKNKSGFEIQEKNLFGLGKSLSLNYNKNTERSETALQYTDPQLLGSRHHLQASVNNNSDGKGYILDLSLPYYSLDSRRAWGINNSRIQQENSIYSKGKVIDKIKVDDESHSIFLGWSNGLKNDSVGRFKVGWNYSDKKYGQLLPITQSYPWFQYEYIQEKYTTRTNFKSMGEVEDIPLGLNYTLEVGLLNNALGSSENNIRLATEMSKGYEFDNSLGLISTDFTTYLGDGKLQGETLNLTGELFTFNDNGSNLYFSGNLRVKNNLQEGEQLILGGGTGLRGYPIGFQDGTKSVVLTAEKRFHFDWYPLQLAKFGAVVFADAGTAWSNDNKAKILTDVGFGLRIIPTRSSSTKALHLDIAFPLDGGNNVDNFQITLKTKQSF